MNTDAATAVPALGAETTGSLSQPEVVGGISLDEVDEDDPFHDDITSGLADGTDAERFASRRARMQRLEQKKLQEEEHQHAVNNPFGQVVFRSIRCIAPPPPIHELANNFMHEPGNHSMHEPANHPMHRTSTPPR